MPRRHGTAFSASIAPNWEFVIIRVDLCSMFCSRFGCAVGTHIIHAPAFIFMYLVRDLKLSTEHRTTKR
jgi:hypothetical protein